MYIICYNDIIIYLEIDLEQKWRKCYDKTATQTVEPASFAHADGRRRPFRTADGKRRRRAGKGLSDHHGHSFYGDCGTDTTYYCFPDGSMAIFGTGAIADYSLLNGNTTAPWYRLGMDSMVQQIMIHKIFVEYGVTRIGDYSFYLSQANSRIILYNLDIANTVTSIGKYAFWGQALEEIIIPPSVIEIGEQAFGNMKNLSRIVCYGDPNRLIWDNIVGERTPKTEVHVLTDYADNLPTASNVDFVADLTDPYASADTKERNITAFYGSVNSHIFGGSAPYIIVGKYDNVKKSVTYGNAGFATCVYYNDAYYALTDNHTGKLYKAVINDQSHKIERCTDEIAPFSLFITHEYVGPNTVKMIYTLKNTGKDEISLKLGSAGDIKIGRNLTEARQRGRYQNRRGRQRRPQADHRGRNTGRLLYAVGQRCLRQNHARRR